MKKHNTGHISLLRCLAAILALVLASGAPAGVSAGGMSGTPSATLYTDRILNGKSVQDVRIDLAEADLAAMLASPLEETYYPATVNIGGLTVTEVGLRTKGNSSLNQVARSESDRFSLKLDFNRYVQGQDLLGLTMLNLNNCMADPSYMREYLSYKILGQAGVPVPAFSYTNVYINGKLWGFYLAVEGIADPFLERWYGTAEGALYKPEGVGSDLVYKSDDASTYTGMTLESHPQYDNGQRLVALLKALDTTGGPVDKARLEEVLDVDEVLRYWAAQTVVINLDGYQGVMLHNYYLYEVDGRFSVIPWDFNMSFAGFSASVSADGGYLYIDTPVAGTTMAARPLINALLSDKAYLERYRGYLRELVEGVFSEKSMQAQITSLTEMIGPYVKADPTSFFTYEKFLSAVDPDAAATVPDRSAEVPGAGGMDGNVVALMSFVRVWNANITAQLAGEIPSTGTVSSIMGGMGGRNPGGAAQFPNMAAPGGAAGRIPGGAPPDGFLPGGAMPDGFLPGGAMPDGFLPGGAMPDGFLPGGANAADVQQRDPSGKAEPATRRMASSMPPAELVTLAAAGLALLAVTLVLWRRKNVHAV